MLQGPFNTLPYCCAALQSTANVAVIVGATAGEKLVSQRVSPKYQHFRNKNFSYLFFLCEVKEKIAFEAPIVGGNAQLKTFSLCLINVYWSRAWCCGQHFWS